MSHPSLVARSQPDKVAYRMAASGRTLTYGELDERSNRGAQLLRALGLRAGDHVAIVMENSLDFLELCWAAQRSGIFYTAVSTYLKADEIAYVVTDCAARVLVVSPAHAALVSGLTGARGLLAFMTGEPLPGFRSWDAERALQPASPIPDETAGFDMLYSSGTTGRPKGVQVTFEAMPITQPHGLLKVLCQDMIGMGPESVYLSPAPLYHAAPLRFTMMSGLLGGTAVIMEKFDAEAYLRIVETHRVTHSQLVPTMFVRMLKLPEQVRARYDVSSLRGAVHAAAPCPVDVKAAMIAWWGPILIEYYAGTEANGVTVATSQDWLDRPGTVGRSIVGRIRILDDAGSVLPPGAVGAVYFADGLPFAYNNDPERTRQAHNELGWSTLGDVGYLDEDGFLFLTDRKSFMIISGGVNVYPREIEDVLITHPAVADVAVFGVPHAEMGEQVKAVVQPRSMMDAGPRLAAELSAFCRSRLSHVKCPASIDFASEMPRTPTGKLMKRLLRDPYWRDEGAQRRTPRLEAAQPER